MMTVLVIVIAALFGIVAALWVVVLLQHLDVIGPLPFDIPGT